MRIAAIGAHFDDVEIGCGGTLQKHVKNGDKVYIVITSADEFRTGLPETRMKEQLEAMKLLGLPRSRLITFSRDLPVEYIVSNLDKFQFDLVFAHYQEDTHQDHRRSSYIAQSVGRKRSVTTIFYESGSSLRFQPNIFSVIDFDFKLKLLQSYQSQINRQSISIDIIRRKNHYLGSLISDDPDVYAEGFVVWKMRYLLSQTENS